VCAPHLVGKMNAVMLLRSQGTGMGRTLDFHLYLFLVSEHDKFGLHEVKGNSAEEKKERREGGI